MPKKSVNCTRQTIGGEDEQQLAYFLHKTRAIIPTPKKVYSPSEFIGCIRNSSNHSSTLHSVQHTVLCIHSTLYFAISVQHGILYFAYNYSTQYTVLC